MTSSAAFESQLERTPTEARLDLFSGDMDPAALIGERLRERRRGATGRRRTALGAVLQAYRGYADTPYAARFSRAVAAFLTDPEAAVRAQALLFFESFPNAAGGEMLVKLAESRRTLYFGVPNPFAPSLDLEWQLLRSIGARILRHDAEALTFARTAVLLPGRARPLIAALALADTQWVEDHADAIVAATPTAAPALIHCLQRSGKDLADVGARIARLAARDPKLRATIDVMILDPAVRRRLFSALP